MNQYLHELSKIDIILTGFLFPLAWKILGAFAVWFIGGILVRTLQKLIVAGLKRKLVDPTLIHYSNASAGLLLKALLILAILSIFGIETTSFSALLAAAGVAIGVAWSGLLSNFAAGVFLIMFRPFKVDDVITAAGVTGVVRVVGLFATTIDNGENLRIFVSNNKIFQDNILNYSANAYRVALFRVQLAHGTEPTAAVALLCASLRNIAGIQKEPEVQGDITEFNPSGIIITLRVPCHNNVYASVLARGNQLIFEALRSANYPIPQTQTLFTQAK
ncbi:MAG: mechanosensitive ion channel family protein [Bdellovibrionales bacterium]|nr:mechanosensitive ion channel family protein [Oligoflexia bacterium]